MKFLIVLFAIFVSCASAGYVQQQQQGGPIASTGTSSQFRSQDSYGNYQFGYDEAHNTGSSGRREESSNGVVRGSYRLGDMDGRARTVNYVADETGFHATISTNEPGVDPSREPANVAINKEQAQIVAPIRAPAPVYAELAPIKGPAAPVYVEQAPLPAPLPEPVFRAPAYAATKSYPSGPSAYERPIQQIQQVIEAPAALPQAFSYSFDANHPTLNNYRAQPAPIAAPEPIFQQRLSY